MKITVRHSDGNPGKRPAILVETLLQRVLAPFLKSIDSIEVTLEPPARGSEEQIEVRCYFTVKLLPDGCIQADASDCDDILAIYRTAEKVKFYLDQRLRSAKKRYGPEK